MTAAVEYTASAAARPRHVVLMSGGTDSLLVWWRLVVQGTAPELLYCHLGQPYAEPEMRVLKVLQLLVQGCLDRPFVVRHSGRVQLGDLEDGATGFIPLRNDLLVRAAVAEGADQVWLGSVAGDRGRDNWRRFAHDASANLSFLLQRPVQVHAPLRTVTKARAIQQFLSLEPLALPLLLATRSCYFLTTDHLSGGTVGCGQCRACARRWVAFTLNGITVERYDHEPGEWLMARATNAFLVDRYCSWWQLPWSEKRGMASHWLDTMRALERAHYIKRSL